MPAGSKVPETTKTRLKKGTKRYQKCPGIPRLAVLSIRAGEIAGKNAGRNTGNLPSSICLHPRAFY
ncbi:hypothetical protein [Methanosarcina sp.]|uniref:hypothetical protein n=1 Tax=Methanosarcina sp. TaxID=2213 RepID=UPI002ABC3ACC|nr:hypothetical protein [Methanosarcina sp.]MDY9926355.1 hypothetical protein [Methanosarcina sp.]